MNSFKRLTHSLTFIIVTSTALSAQISGGDILNEAPLYKIPADMTYEEFVDMNRRLTVGLALAAVPIPGMIHFYAGEKKTGRKILRNAGIAVGIMVLGMAMSEQGDFPDTEYEKVIFNAGHKENERQFMKFPTGIFGSDTTFKLIELGRDPEGGGNLVFALGIAVLVIDIAYDYLHGIKIIEEKRAKVRYKYGKTLSFSVMPQINRDTRGAGLKFSIGL